jgi:hypothetical protein
VAISLIRQVTDFALRDTIFTEMVKLRQWGVCRALLDQGVSVSLCMDALPQLMDANQWILVARVMEFDVGDETRRQVMQRALDRREGSVVWRCISIMQNYRLYEKERIDLFKHAFSRGIWQIVKSLVEIKDDTGVQHRDTVLPTAIDQHQWDVVDFCQLHGADINMQDENKETPLNRAARKSDWEAVDELLVREGNPNILDMHGCSVLNLAISDEQWKTVKTGIEYLGDVHKKAGTPYRQVTPLRTPYRQVTPLQFLIEKRQGKLINHMLMWCPDLWKGVTEKGATSIHTMCASGSEDCMYYQVRRGVNPLANTTGGMSPLAYAVQAQGTGSPQKMVFFFLL